MHHTQAPKLQLRRGNVLPSALRGLRKAVVHFQDFDALCIVLVLQQLEHLPELSWARLRSVGTIGSETQHERLR